MTSEEHFTINQESLKPLTLLQCFAETKTRWFKHHNSNIQEWTWFCRLQKICAYASVFVLYSNIPVMSQEIWGFILIPSDLQDPVSLITEERCKQCCNPCKNTEIIIISVTWPIHTQIRSFQASSRTGHFSREKTLDTSSRM